MHRVFELALVADPVSINRDTFAGDRAVFPIALICAAIREDDLAVSFGFAVDESAFID